MVLDWLPWSHTFGGNHNFNLVLRNGGTLYIDEGRPAPGLVEKSVKNLLEVKPTLYFNVPRGFDMLLPFLEKDDALAREFFARLRMVFYAGAALAQSSWERLEAVARKVRDEPVWFTTSWGSTETSPAITSAHWQLERAGCIGLPLPGMELKFVPNGEKLETARARRVGVSRLPQRTGADHAGLRRRRLLPHRRRRFPGRRRAARARRGLQRPRGRGLQALVGHLGVGGHAAAARRLGARAAGAGRRDRRPRPRRGRRAALPEPRREGHARAPNSPSARAPRWPRCAARAAARRRRPRARCGWPSRPTPMPARSPTRATSTRARCCAAAPPRSRRCMPPRPTRGSSAPEPEHRHGPRPLPVLRRHLDPRRRAHADGRLLRRLRRRQPDRPGHQGRA